MADKSHQTAAPAPAVTSPDQIRNVVLVGHTGSGKTTLIEALLHATGTIPRMGSIAEGTTVSDHDEQEIRQQRSVTVSLAPLVHQGIKVNLLDAPGYADFVGELRAGLRAADAALFVVSAVDGVDGVTAMLWDECAAVDMPRAIVVSKLDQQRADFDTAVAICQGAFGGGVMPLHRVVRDGDAPATGLIDLLRRTEVDVSGGTRHERPLGDDQSASIDAQRNALIEAIIAESEDETLMDRYLAGEDVDLSILVADLESAVARGHFYPVLATAASTNFGLAEVLDLLTQGFPSPTEHTLPQATTPNGGRVPALTADPDGPLCAEVVKTTSDQYVGRISLVRVFSGRLRPDMPVHVSGHVAEFFGSDRGHDDHDVDERIGALSCPLGATQRTVSEAIAGDLVAVAKLSRAETGDTLSSVEHPLLVEPWQLPDPLLPIAVVAHATADEDKLSQALARLVAEDPTMRLETNADTHQVVLWCMGEAHADLLIHRLADRYGVHVDVEPVRLSLRETVRAPARGHGRHVKQSGGHGQFAICDLEVEPLAAGSGIEFVDKVVGGAVPRQFIPSVEKGVRTQLARGTGSGYPMVDVRITLVDGKAHSVDSSDAAFQTAGGLALRDAAAAAGIDLLEPVDVVSVLVADEHVGAVMSDLAGRRGRVGGSAPVDGGRTSISAEVPGSELTRYAIELRSLSHGTGTFTRRYVRHEPMPRSLAQSVLEAESA
jgi:elongation factor G